MPTIASYRRQVKGRKDAIKSDLTSPKTPSGQREYSSRDHDCNGIIVPASRTGIAVRLLAAGLRHFAADAFAEALAHNERVSLKARRAARRPH